MTLLSRRVALAAVALMAAIPISSTSATAQQGAIRIGEVNSFGRFPAITVPWRNGFRQAIEEVNAAGGIRGQKIEIVSQDDGGTPADAVRAAEDLVTRNNVSLIAGGFVSPVAFALSDFAKQKKVVFICSQAASDALTMAQGNRYTFRLRSNTYMIVKTMTDVAAKLGKKRWAIVAPNYEYGHAAAENFKQMMSAQVPGFEVVAEQFPALGKIEAGPTVAAIQNAKPDGIFNVLFGADLVKFVREGEPRGLFEGRTVLGYETGMPEWVDIMREEAPKGWIVNGYPWYSIEYPAHKKFVADYQAKYKDYPRHGSFIGYVTGLLVGDALRKAKDTTADSIIAALEGLKIETPVGAMTMRASDHQLTYGTFMGKLAIEGGKGVVKDWFYRDGAEVMYPEEIVQKLRPKD